MILKKVKITKSNGFDSYSVESLGSKTIANYSKEETIKSFFNFWMKEKPKIVTFNGRIFDIPLLKLRAIKYNIPAKSFILWVIGGIIILIDIL